MLTEKQIRARFNKAHLRKLAKELLAIEYVPWNGGKRAETPVKLYTLRPGVSVDQIAERVRYYRMFASDDQMQSFAKVEGEVYEDGVWRSIGTRLRLRRVIGMEPKAYEVVGGYGTYPTDEEGVDRWIKSTFLDRECFMINNSARDIYLPLGGRK